MNIGKRIHQLRISQGQTQGDLAIKLGVSKSTVAMWETDKRSPSDKAMQKLAELNAVPVAYFYVDDPQELKGLSNQERNILDALHKNPRIGMLFDRQLRMKPADIDTMLLIAERFIREDDD